MDTFNTAQKIIKDSESFLSKNDLAFASRVFAAPLEHYRDRLEAISFQGMENVLDAGCGFGQWLFPLAQLNANVSACDVAGERLIIADKICQAIKPKPVLKNCRLESLDFPQNAFDGVFCYGVVHATEWRKSISEFSRVLKKDGKLYLTANGLGWYLHCWKNQPNKTQDYDPRFVAARALLNTVAYERYSHLEDATSGLIIEQEDLVKQLKDAGFLVENVAAEGTINLGRKKIPPNFKGEYEGHTGVYEVLAVKKD
jgi:ubiquinone/menaquinone biosynthesis C-methylase UbiE